MAHSHLVLIREDEGHSGIDVAEIFADDVELAAEIAGGPADKGQEGIVGIHELTSPRWIEHLSGVEQMTRWSLNWPFYE